MELVHTHLNRHPILFPPLLHYKRTDHPLFSLEHPLLGCGVCVHVGNGKWKILIYCSLIVAKPCPDLSHFPLLIKTVVIGSPHWGYVRPLFTLSSIIYRLSVSSAHSAYCWMLWYLSCTSTCVLAQILTLCLSEHFPTAKLCKTLQVLLCSSDMGLWGMFLFLWRRTVRKWHQIVCYLGAHFPVGRGCLLSYFYWFL